MAAVLEPSSHQEALATKEWKSAMDDELYALQKKQDMETSWASAKNQSYGLQVGV